MSYDLLPKTRVPLMVAVSRLAFNVDDFEKSLFPLPDSKFQELVEPFTAAAAANRIKIFALKPLSPWPDRHSLNESESLYPRPTEGGFQRVKPETWQNNVWRFGVVYPFPVYEPGKILRPAWFFPAVALDDIKKLEGAYPQLRRRTPKAEIAEWIKTEISDRIARSDRWSQDAVWKDAQLKFNGAARHDDVIAIYENDEDKPPEWSKPGPRRRG